ncbi:hypothetical protein HYFRA_00012478 [Hymenoscyphus fraxineus]|uniref:Uncharacterized protein n=1 Tax=Hymenoscyphus fraxineus TaxID=746836 RepID=A0A9N9L007_9HELO|nr:hypothetical protein HYFRA_00012478 [Hymenoscyphus fraxineus]
MQSPSSPPAIDISTILATSKPDLKPYEDLYRHFHEFPGLSLQEHLAAETAARYLRELDGFDVRTNIGGTGLIGILKNGEGKTVLLRADTDALPVEELTAFTKQFGDKHDPEAPVLGAFEDFAILATEAPDKNDGKGVPYTYWTFGGTDPEKLRKAKERGDSIPLNHSPYFAPVIKPTLSTGVDALIVAALSYLA